MRKEHPQSPIRLPQHSGDVPAFSLVVYVVRRGSETEVRAANLAGFSCRAGDERAALQKLLPQIKQRVSECLAKNEPIRLARSAT